MNCQCRGENGQTVVCDECASQMIEASHDPDAVELVQGMLAREQQSGLVEAASSWLDVLVARTS